MALLVEIKELRTIRCILTWVFHHMTDSIKTVLVQANYDWFSLFEPEGVGNAGKGAAAKVQYPVADCSSPP